MISDQLTVSSYNEQFARIKISQLTKRGKYEHEEKETSRQQQ